MFKIDIELPSIVLFFSLFSVALVYFGAGMLYNKFVNHQSGIQILPHAQFWIGFPLYTIVSSSFSFIY